MRFSSLKNILLVAASKLRILAGSLFPPPPAEPPSSGGKPGRRRRHKIPNMPVLLLICLASGVIAGYATTLAILKTADAVVHAGENSVHLIRFVFGKSIPLVGKISDGSFVFSDFEKPGSEKAWMPIGASFESTDRFPSQGARTGHVYFSSKARQSTLILDDLLKSRKGGSDWTGYKSLFFTVFTPVKEEVRLSMQITDLWGKQYREMMKFSGGRGVSISIPLEKIAGVVTLSKIDTLAFSITDEKEDREFYFDDIRLIPKGKREPFGAVSGGEASQAQARNVPLEKRKVNFFDYDFKSRKAAWTLGQAGPLKDIVRVPFVVKNETPYPCRFCSVEGALPFPAGELKDLEKMRLHTPKGEEIAFQPRVLSRWPDGSVRWLALSFEESLGSWQGTGYFLDYGAGIRRMAAPESRLKVREDAQSVEVDTGVLRSVLDRNAFFLFSKVFVDENGDSVFEDTEQRVSDASLSLVFRGKQFRTDLSRADYKLEVEEKGPHRVVIRAEGWFKSEEGSRFCKAIVRYYFYEGKSEVKIAHTLIYTGYPENRFYGEYEGLDLPANETVESFGIQVPLKGWKEDEPLALRLGRHDAPPLELAANEKVRLVQKGWEQSVLYKGPETLENQGLFSGWAEVSSPVRGLSVSVRRFRENYPKAFGFDPAKQALEIDLWPAEQGPLDLSTTAKALGPGAAARGNAFGLGKTHEMLFYFHRGNARDSLEKMESFSRRLLIRSNPFWADATGALGRLFPADKRYQKQELMLEELFDWADRHPKYFQWYGMINFGDTLTWWRSKDEEKDYGEFGWHPEGRWGWYNAEGVGTHTGSLLQFVRSGKWKYFEFGENLARHIFDIDTIHYNTIAEDPRLKKVLNDEFSQPGSMHRHNGDHWGGRSDEASHTNLNGILLYYYLTGDERAWDVAREIGEFFLKERFTYAGHPDIAPHRGLANALWGDVLMFEATGDERYKNAADKLIEIFLKGQQPDGSFLENYNPQKDSWSGEKEELFMSWYDVGAFISYHELTQDVAVKEMLLKLVRYLAKSESSGPVILHGLAYAYLISHDAELIKLAENYLAVILKNQINSENPVLDGLIYDKPIYHRPNIYLYTVPYVFGALEEAYIQERKAAAAAQV